MGDGGLLALQSRSAEAGSKPPRGALAEDLVNMSVGSEAGMGNGRSRGLRCCMGDGGLLALQSRSAEAGSKPPRGALAEDRGLERRGKRRGKGPRQVWTGKMSDGRKSSVVNVSKTD